MLRVSTPSFGPSLFWRNAGEPAAARALGEFPAVPAALCVMSSGLVEGTVLVIQTASGDARLYMPLLLREGAAIIVVGRVGARRPAARLSHRNNTGNGREGLRRVRAGIGFSSS